jgi:hypothetical protein
VGGVGYKAAAIVLAAAIGAGSLDAPPPHPDEAASVDALRRLGARLTFDEQGYVRIANLAGVEQFDDRGAKHLKPLSRLKNLYLGGTQVTDQGLVELQGLSRLHFLSLAETRVTAEAVERLREALPTLKVYHSPVDPKAKVAAVARGRPPMVRSALRGVRGGMSMGPGLPMGRRIVPAAPPRASKPSVDPFLGELNMVGAHSIGRGTRGSWSPDASRLALGRSPAGSGILVHYVASGNATELVAAGKDPAWSPQGGRWIAYTRESEDGGRKREEIWLVEATGGNPRRIAQGAFPTWSADATKVCFFARESRQVMAVRVDQPDDGPVVLWKAPAADLPAGWCPVVSPDGRHVAYHGNDSLEIVDLATARTLHSWPLPDWSGLLAGWSPDGKHLGFGAAGGEDRDLWVLSLADGKARRVLSGWCTLPNWSQDGARLAFDLRSGLGDYEVWIVATENLNSAARVSGARDRRP